MTPCLTPLLDPGVVQPGFRLVDLERPVWTLGNKAKAGLPVWPALGILGESRRGWRDKRHTLRKPWVPVSKPWRITVKRVRQRLAGHQTLPSHDRADLRGRLQRVCNPRLPLWATIPTHGRPHPEGLPLVAWSDETDSVPKNWNLLRQVRERARRRLLLPGHRRLCAADQTLRIVHVLKESPSGCFFLFSFPPTTHQTTMSFT